MYIFPLRWFNFQTRKYILKMFIIKFFLLISVVKLVLQTVLLLCFFVVVFSFIFGVFVCLFRKREKHCWERAMAAFCTLHGKTGLQPGHIAWLKIKPVTSWFMGWPNLWAIPLATLLIFKTKLDANFPHYKFSICFYLD